jgi:hypothetical protein
MFWHGLIPQPHLAIAILDKATMRARATERNVCSAPLWQVSVT